MNDYEKSTPVDTTNTNYDEVVTEDSKSSKNNRGKNKLVVIVIIILLLLGALGVFIYYRVVNSKNIFKTLINDTYTYLESNMNTSDTVSGTFNLKVDGTSSDSSTNDMLGILGNIELTGNYGIDYKNKIMNMDIDSKYEGNKLLDVNLYTENSNAYVELVDLYDKYIQMPVEDYDSLFNSTSNVDDTKVVLKSVRDALNKSLKDEYFTKEKIDVDGVKTTKTTLKLDKENYNSIKKDVINELLNDNEFLDSASALSDTSVDDIKESLNDYLEEEEFEGADVSIYTKGFDNEFVKFEIVGANDSFSVIQDGDTYNFEVTSNENVIYDGSLKITENKDDVTCNFTINDKQENNSIKLDLSSSTKYDEKIDKLDVSNSVNYENMTEEETNGIATKLLENETIMKLMEDFSKVSSSSSLSTTDNFSSDSSYDMDDYNF